MNRFCLRGHDTHITGRSKRHTCMVCDRERRRKKYWQTRNAHLKRMMRNYLKRTFGITPEERARGIEAQNGLCAFCGRPPGKQALHLDHDHTTGKLRGYLCYRCNRYLVGAHTLKSARTLVNYLEQYQ